MQEIVEKKRCSVAALQKQSSWRAPIHFFETVTSTNDVLLELGEAGEPEGTIVIAETQTRGRGQFHRPWSNPFGMGLWMSLLLRLPIENEVIPSLSQLGPVALCDVFEKLTISLPLLKIKAPNDLLVGGKKMAGVLVETRRCISPFAVVGIGFNLDQQQNDFPPELRDKATSLALVAPPIDRWQLTATLIQSLYERYEQLRFHPQQLAAAWHFYL